MKRTIIIEILLIFALAISIYFNYHFWNSVSELNALIQDNFWNEQIDMFQKSINTNIIYGVLTLISDLLILTAMTLIAIKDFPVFKPLVDKITAHKKKCAVIRAEQAENKKQARIKKLQMELDNLKIDNEK